MSHPLVSIVIPAFNAAAYIEQTLASIFWQEWPTLQIIVVDDGSTDSTPEILREWQARYPEQIEVHQQKLGGPAPVRNFGISKARGEYLAFLDADDVWWPGKLAAQIAFLQQHDGEAVVFGRFVPWEAGSDGVFKLPEGFHDSCYDSSVSSEESGWVYSALLQDVITHTCALAGPTALFKRHGGFRDDLLIGEDYDLWLRLSRDVPFYAQRGNAVLYRQHASSITRQPRERNFEYERVVEALERWGRSGPDNIEVRKDVMQQRLATLAFGHGYMHYHNGSKRVSLRSMRLAIKHRPTMHKAWLYVAAALASLAMEPLRKTKAG